MWFLYNLAYIKHSAKGSCRGLRFVAARENIIILYAERSGRTEIVMYDYDVNKYDSKEETTNNLDFEDDLYNDLWAPYEDETQATEDF